MNFLPRADFNSFSRFKAESFDLKSFGIDQPPWSELGCVNLFCKLIMRQDPCRQVSGIAYIDFIIGHVMQNVNVE